MKISVLGMGAYGIALSKVLHDNDNKIVIWSKYQEEVDSVKLHRENKALLPKVKIPKDIILTSDIKEAIENSKIIIIAVPTLAVREVAGEIAKYLKSEQVICICSKGLEKETNKRMSEVVYEETNNKNICFLAGPSFATDLANRNEQGFVVASSEKIAAITVKIALENDRVVVNDIKDIVGVEYLSAIKNVYAILLGICDGMKLSESTRAAILTCVVQDIRLIVELLGGKLTTVLSYAGIGDLLLTCMSNKSRNYTYGKFLGKGLSSDEAKKSMNVSTIEGISTLSSIYHILAEKEVNVKSISLLYNIIYHNLKVVNILREIKNS